MRFLVIKILIFSLPLAAILAFPAWVLVVSGELTPVDEVVARQKLAAPMLVEYAYTEKSGIMKLKAVRDRRPDIIALGSSRVMQFRADFFNRSFYNAGIAGSFYEDLRRFITLLAPEEQPQLIILGLDALFFNPDWHLQPRDVFSETEKPFWKAVLDVWDKVYVDWFKRKFKISDLTKPRADGTARVGLAAFANDCGFRNDGSHQWYWWEDSQNDLHKIARNEGAYLRAGLVSEKSIVHLESLLELCRERGIRVAGFLPPYSPSVYQALLLEKERYVHVFTLAQKVGPVFERYGFAFMDFTDPAPFGFEKKGFVDGQHASEDVYRGLWSVWTTHEPPLRAYAALPVERRTRASA